jgi:hypothetical protein
LTISAPRPAFLHEFFRRRVREARVDKTRISSLILIGTWILIFVALNLAGAIYFNSERSGSMQI